MRKHESLDERLLDVIRRESRSVIIRKDVGGARKVLRSFAALAQPTVSTEQYNELMSLSYSTEESGIFGAIKKIFVRNPNFQEHKLYGRSGLTEETIKLLDDTIEQVESGKLVPTNRPINIGKSEIYVDVNDPEAKGLVQWHNRHLSMRVKLNGVWDEICTYIKKVLTRINPHIDTDDDDAVEEEVTNVWDKHFKDSKFINLLKKLESAGQLKVTGDCSFLAVHIESIGTALENKIDEIGYDVNVLKGNKTLKPLSKEEILGALHNLRTLISNEVKNFGGEYTSYNMMEEDVEHLPEDYIEYVVAPTHYYLGDLFYGTSSINYQVNEITRYIFHPNYITDHYSWVMMSLGK